jgi:transcriptional regulator with XRE-family HTH domain
VSQQIHGRRPHMPYLREWREHSGLSQEALAQAAGVSTSTISRAERRRYLDVRPSIVRKIEAALGREPFGLETPPPGVPDLVARSLVDVVDALYTIVNATDGVLGTDCSAKEDEDDAAAFVRWAMAQPEDLHGGRLELPDPLALRQAAYLVEEIADAQEAANEERQTVQ